VEAASDKRAAVYEIGSSILGDLATIDDRALGAVKEMSRSRLAHIRHNAVLCIAEETPKDVARNVMRELLADKSSRVRSKAADWSGRMRARELLPDLAQALLSETNTETRKIMSNELRLLRDGYVAEPAGDGTAITVCTSSGTRITKWARSDLVQERGIEAIAKELASGV
jgi:hypothetical protein